VDEEIIDKVETLLLKLEDHDDVQGVYMNAVFAEETIS
jgi:transcriptional/translational regulatory protein YebC/TACO1